MLPANPGMGAALSADLSGTTVQGNAANFNARDVSLSADYMVVFLTAVLLGQVAVIRFDRRST
jgi:hypothetical protein